jgi:integrase/recombinase XerD
MACLYRRNGSNIWWIRFQKSGVRIQRSTGTTRRVDALRYLARAMEEERQRQEAGFKKVPFGVLCDEFRQQHLPVLRPTTRSNYLMHMRVLREHFGDRYIDEIRKAHIAAFIAEQRRRALKPCTVRRYLATLSSLFSFAERSGWTAQNPLARFDRRSLPEAAPRTRFLSRDEFRRLLACADDHLKPILEVAVETGMRAGELLTLTWSKVDLDRREVRLEDTKSKRPRVVPLTDRAVAALVASRYVHEGPYVFTNPNTGHRYTTLKKAFHGACRRAGITDFRFHDLRHTFASWAVQNGMDLYRLSRILGHATLQMSTRYAHLGTDQLHEAVRDMATSMATRASDSSLMTAQPVSNENRTA